MFIGIILSSNVFIRLLDSTSLHILGFTSSITINEVVIKTNEERIKAGLPALNYSEKLSDAARRKAANMLEENYWAHNSPSGKNPWVWFKAAGYNYLYAGENLAKDFGDTSRMISAWMASPTHHDNIVNPKYKEIGIAVVPGTLLGSDTMLVVQLFGAPGGGALPVDSSPTEAPQANQEVSNNTPQSGEPVPQVKAVTQESVDTLIAEISPPKYNSFELKKVLSLFTTALFIIALLFDLILSESAVLSRRVGKNWAHIVFINIILLAITIVHAGQIR